MEGLFVHESAVAKNVCAAGKAAIYKECFVDGAEMGDRSSIGDFSRVFHAKLGEHVMLQRNAMVFNTSFGKYSYTGKNFTSWYASIGAFCSISWNVSIGGADHDYERTTSHSILYDAKDYDFLDGDGGEPVYDRFEKDCVIGSDVWIGANACICRNVTVGNGAVIGAGAVVKKDIPPYAIAVGVPARVIKYRFSPEIIELLQKARWWDFSDECLKRHFDLLKAKMTLDVASKLYEIRTETGRIEEA